MVPRQGPRHLLPDGPLCCNSRLGRRLGDFAVECRVNDELRQSATTADLVFDIPDLIATISAGLTLAAGRHHRDRNSRRRRHRLHPPRFLRGGDLVEISITGLGTLRNRVARPAAPARSSSPQAKGTLMKLSTGREVFVESAGEGPAVVFVHGLGGTTNFYEPQASALAARHRVVRFDLPGAGRSPFAGECSIESFADDIEAVMDAAGIDHASIVGHSMGTIAVQYFAATRPGPRRQGGSARSRARAATGRQGGHPPAREAGPRARHGSCRRHDRRRSNVRADAYQAAGSRCLRS